MLIERNSISKKSFISRCFILLINFSFFQKFNFGLHNHNLFLEIENKLIVHSFGSLTSCFVLDSSLCCVVRTFQVWITFKLFLSAVIFVCEDVSFLYGSLSTHLFICFLNYLKIYELFEFRFEKLYFIDEFLI